MLAVPDCAQQFRQRNEAAAEFSVARQIKPVDSRAYLQSQRAGIAVELSFRLHAPSFRGESAYDLGESFGGQFQRELGRSIGVAES
jgi:hypothetical protein